MTWDCLELTSPLQVSGSRCLSACVLRHWVSKAADVVLTSCGIVSAAGRLSSTV